MRDETKTFLSPAYTRLAVFAGADGEGRPLVTLDGEPRAAESLVPLGGVRPGTDLAVLFLEGDPARPLILGALVPPRVAEIDGRIELVGEREVVLRCGPASIRLTPDGRVTIRGTRILSRSDGANRVQGASVELN